ncbi:hypothetical protein QYF61_021266 [Mycteria americana]|uniref:Uncharacterized protein n=1 Tax=Mycteria americana TaxID=33587 RepID=A0AAN7MJ61_MYCAM|nr:hypothetical protein QYF61_021265 [Mycteria americana]KAK4806670.1 hypothetical protein QYF61_021266 [Mycteria americana]
MALASYPGLSVPVPPAPNSDADNGLGSTQEQKARTGAAEGPWAVPGILQGLPSTFMSQRPAMPLWVWILRSALTLLFLASAPIITLILEAWSHCASGARQPRDIPVPVTL